MNAVAFNGMVNTAGQHSASAAAQRWKDSHPNQNDCCQVARIPHEQHEVGRRRSLGGHLAHFHTATYSATGIPLMIQVAPASVDL